MTRAGDPELTPDPDVKRPGLWAGLHAAVLVCENCGEETPHRIVRIARDVRRSSGDVLAGVARCTRCRWTHRFELGLPSPIDVRTVVSERGRSALTVLRVPSQSHIQVGSRVPDQDRPLRVLRIDRHDQTSVGGASAEEVATLWVAPDTGRVIPVSLVLGSKTAPTRAVLNPETELTVGEPLTVAGGAMRVFALRALGKTWSRPGDRFPARTIQRIYARRTDTPPAGRSRWRRSRETPTSRANSASRSSRSRSSPGVRRKRSVPRDRSAEGGATLHKSSPS